MRVKQWGTMELPDGYEWGESGGYDTLQTPVMTLMQGAVAAVLRAYAPEHLEPDQCDAYSADPPRYLCEQIGRAHV